MPHESPPRMKHSTLSSAPQTAQSFWNQVNTHLRDSIWKYSSPNTPNFLHGCSARGTKRRLLWALSIRIVSRSSSSTCIGRCKAKRLCFGIRFWKILAHRPIAWCPEFSYGIRCALHWGFSQNVNDVKQKGDLILFAFIICLIFL